MTRVGGNDRYETAVAVAAGTPKGVATVYVASGADFPDALAGAAVAAAGDVPVLLTKPGDLPDVTAAAISELAPASVVILGGSGAVSTTVENQLRALGVGTVSRIEGSDRYATAAKVAARLPGATSAYVASGAAFPDALAGAALAGHLGAPVLLTRPTSLPDVTATALRDQQPTAITVLGGTGVVSSAVASELGAYIVR